MALKLFKRKKQEDKPKAKREKVKLDRTRESEIEERVENDIKNNEPELNPKSKDYKKKKKEQVKEHLLMHNMTLDRIAPRGNIKFNSIDFLLDGRVATILTFIVRPGTFNNLRPLWGIDTIPKLISNKRLREKNIEAKILHSFERRSDSWAEGKLGIATEVTSTGFEESSNSSQALSSKIFKQHYEDINEVTQEISNGAKYLDLSIRVSLKAQTQEDLQEAINVIEGEYNSVFGSTVELVPFVCEQDTEYANMLDTARKQRGENYMLTSRELAGSYMFVTRGINDPYGSYIGQLSGEVNNDPVLLDSLKFKKLAVIYARDRGEDLTSKFYQNVRYSYKATTAWGVKVAQDALAQGKRVVEFVLNQEEPLKVGMNLKNLTAYIPMDDKAASINMFECFSKGFDEIPAFNILLDKLKVIIEQFNTARSEKDDTIMFQEDFDNLEDICTAFYIYKKMWVEKPKEQKEDIRLINIPSKHVPVLDEFQFFLSHVLGNAQSEQQVYGLGDKLRSVNKLERLIRRINNRHGDIFGRTTTVRRDAIRAKERVIFDFKTLRLRSEEALMGQFLNSFSYGEQELEEDDVVIIHGMDQMTPTVLEFLTKRFNELHERGVKVVLLYENQDILFSEEKAYRPHNDWFRNADMRITNSMSAKNQAIYERLLVTTLPESVKNGLSGSDTYTYFLNRDRESIMFNIDYTH